MQLFYRIYGKGTPIVMLHGLYASYDSWMGLADDFKHSFQLILVDLRNHGRSPHSSDFSYESMSVDILELLNSLSINQVVLVGHSMGGKVAMHFSLRHPSRVKGLVVEDISPFAYPKAHENVLFHQKIISTLKSLRVNEYSLRSEVETVLGNELSDIALSRFLLKNLGRNRSGSFEWRINLDALADNLYKITESVTEGISNTLDIPCLFIKSLTSKYISKEDEKAICLFFPHANIVTIQDSGHWIHNEQKISFIQTVKWYLSLLNSTD